MTSRSARKPDESVISPLLIGMGRVSEIRGGGNRYLHDLRQALASLGERPTTLVLSRLDRGLAEDVLAVESPDSSVVLRVLAFRRAVKRFAPDCDVVNSHFALYGLAAQLSRAGRRLPLVVSFHGPWADESRVASRSSRWLTSIKRSIERTHYRRATSLVTLSAAFAELLNAQYGVSRGRIHVVRPGVDLDHFRPGDRVRAREELGWDQGTFAAVSVRRLTPRMGLEYLLDAWSQLPPSTHLYIAGQGSDESRLRALILRLGLEQSVTLVGGVSDEDLTRLYVAADISVVPSVALEGFGLVVLESLACGTPVVASDTGGMAEVLRTFAPGLLIAPGDSKSLATLLVQLVDRHESLPSAAACRKFAEGFTWQAAAQQIEAIFRDAIAATHERV